MFQKWKEIKSYWSFLGLIGASVKASSNKDAIKKLSSAIELEGQMPNAETVKEGLADAYYRRAHLYSKKRDTLGLVANDCLKVIELAPQHARAWNLLGFVYLEHEENATKAVECFEKSIQFDGAYAYSYYNLGKVHLKSNQIEEAIEFFTKAISLMETGFSDFWLKRALCYFKLGSIDLAFSDYQKSLPFPADKLSYRIRFLIKLKGKERLMKQLDIQDIMSVSNKVAFKKNMQLLSQVDQVVKLFRESLSYHKNQEYEREKECLNSILKIDDQLGMIYLMLGNNEQAVGDVRTANKYYSRADSLGFDLAREAINVNHIAKIVGYLDELSES